MKVPLLMGLAMAGSELLNVPVRETVETVPFAAGYMPEKRRQEVRDKSNGNEKD